MKLILIVSFLVRVPLLVTFTIIGRLSALIAGLCGRLNYILISTLPGVQMTYAEEENTQTNPAETPIQ